MCYKPTLYPQSLNNIDYPCNTAHTGKNITITTITRPFLLPGDQGRDDIRDGGVEVSQHLLNGPWNGQLLTQVFGTTHLLPVLADDFSQLFTPEERRGSQESKEARRKLQRTCIPTGYHFLMKPRCGQDRLFTFLLLTNYTCIFRWKMAVDKSIMLRNHCNSPVNDVLAPRSCDPWYM